MPEDRQFCSFIVNDLLLGADVRRVQEVVRDLEITSVPSAPWAVRGLVNLRGQVIEAIDIRRCFGIADSAPVQTPFHLIFRTPGGPVSLLVDDMGSVIEIASDSPSVATQTLKGRMREIVSAVYRLSNRLLLVVDMDRLLGEIAGAKNSAIDGGAA
ncbi:MAG TPA: chemotaxis protein CheW [Candidatus Acidoferrales bacterium]